MKKIIIIGGSGVAGKIIFDILNRKMTDTEIHIGCRHKPDNSKEDNYVYLDVNEEDSISIIKNYQFAILALGPYEKLGNIAHKRCIDAQVDCLDINDSISSWEEINKLDFLAQQKK